MKSVYVAGGWEFRVRLKLLMDTIQEKGLTVTSKWIERENGVNTPEALASDANFDISEVCASDYVLAILDDTKYAYRGTFTEIGCALGAGKRVIIVCPGEGEKLSDTRYNYSHYCMTNVFYWHPSIVHVTTVEEAINIINE